MIASSIACIIGLTWGGVKFPWASAQVLVPLILGLVGMCGFLVYEAIVAKNPVVRPLPVMITKVVPHVAPRFHIHSFLIGQASAGTFDVPVNAFLKI